MRGTTLFPALLMVLPLILVLFLVAAQAAEPTQLIAEFSEDWYGTKFTIILMGESAWEIGSEVPVKVVVTVKDMGDNQRVTFRQLSLELFGTGVMSTTPLDVSTTAEGEAFSKTVVLRVINAFGLMAPGTTSTYPLTMTLEGSVIDGMGFEWPGLTMERASITVVAPQSPITIDAEMPSEVTVGEEFEIKLRIRNDGKYPISNLKITLYPMTGVSSVGPLDKIFEKLSPGETAEASFRLKAESEGSGPISVGYSYHTYWDYYMFDLYKTLGSITVKRRAACIIATAAFGTELDPHVQYLRSFRDGLVMKTFAGSSFMKIFNAWYYSWAPYIAAAELSYEPLRQMIKYALYPLIGVLHASVKIYDLLSFNPEIGVIASGIFASFMIGLLYFSPIAMMILFLLKIAPSKRAIMAGVIACLIALVGAWMSVILQFYELAMVTTSALVLSTITLTMMLAMKGMHVLMTQIRSKTHYNE
ncbi:MAG: CFI-box-CTERM domain-containing protein [Nitrososphaerota archaeon]